FPGKRRLEEAERLLRESEERYSRLSASSFEAIVIHENSIIVDVNDAMTTISDYSREELIGMSAWKLFSPESHPLIMEKLQAGYEDPYEVIGITKNGVLKPLEMQGKMVHYHGNLARVVVARDISERKRAEEAILRAEALRASEARMRELFDASPIGVTVTEMESGCFLFANARVQEMLGYAGTPLEGVDALDFYVDPNDRFAILDTVKKDGAFSDCEVLVKGAGGVEMWVLASGRSIEYEGKPALLGWIYDISNRKLVENELEAAKESAEKAVRIKTHFLAAASHDLRQPLQALILFVEALAFRQHDEKSGDLIAKIRSSVDALEQLLNMLLDVSRFDAGLIVPEKSRFSLSEMLERLVEEYGALCREKGIVCRKRIIPDIMIETDPTLLERVSRNLMSNALNYTESGGILIATRRRAGGVRIEIWDTGIGIPPEQRERIFEDFYQLDNPSRDRRKGLGLGLAIVSRLANLLGTPVNVRSIPGKGSVFSVDIPSAQSVFQ
ncbi:MAG: PAS domain S-box protein, partial [Rhodospirillales bacterium]|nr:PAS domain S-box protein [Rhodospirillales bacterium]